MPYPNFDIRFEPAFQLKQQAEFDAAFLAVRRELGQIKMALLARKYNASQPRVPAGSPLGGQWTRPIAASPDTIDGILSGWAEAGFGSDLLLQVAEADIPSLADSVMDWLGPGAFQLNSPNGATQFFSADRSRLIRFDITPDTSHGHNPHINLEPGRRHIYLR